jgi:outer membrane protein assembly factor BamB
VFVDGLLILTYDGIDQQFLTALDAVTGETRWRTDRSTDYGDLQPDGTPLREGDLRKAYSTPGVIEVAGRKQIVSVGSRAAFAYDLLTGAEVWTVTHDDYNAAAQPLSWKNTAIFNTGSRGANLISLRLDESTRGDVTESHVAWDRTKGNSRLAFPVLHGGRIYSVTDSGVVACIDADTGNEIWAGRVGGNYVASPLIANDLLYLFNEEGTGTVVRLGNEFEILTRNVLAEGVRASPAVANGALFLRTFGHLYRIALDK